MGIVRQTEYTITCTRCHEWLKITDKIVKFDDFDDELLSIDSFAGFTEVTEDVAGSDELLKWYLCRTCRVAFQKFLEESG
jgi:hypothetical protein